MAYERHEASGGPFWDMAGIKERIPNMTLNVLMVLEESSHIL